MTSILDQLENDAKELGVERSNSNFYEVEEGNNNVVRILTKPLAFAQYFYGKGVKPAIAYGFEKGDPRGRGKDDDVEQKSIRYVMYVLDRNTDTVKMAMLPYSVMLGLGQLQDNPDYNFDDYPMPYDIRIAYNKEASPAQKYSVTNTRNENKLTTEEENMLHKALNDITPEDMVAKMKENQMKADKEAGVWLSPEAQEQMQKDFVEKAKKELEAQGETGSPELNVVDYPDGYEEPTF